MCNIWQLLTANMMYLFYVVVPIVVQFTTFLCPLLQRSAVRNCANHSAAGPSTNRTRRYSVVSVTRATRGVWCVTVRRGSVTTATVHQVSLVNLLIIFLTTRCVALLSRRVADNRLVVDCIYTLCT